MDRKYIIDRDCGGVPKTLQISDVIIAKNMKNNSYRKRCRIGIMLHLYRNKINPLDYLRTLELDALRLVAFYFNVVILEKQRKSTLIQILNPIIIAKLKIFHSKLKMFCDDIDDWYSLVEYIRCKL